MRYDEPSSTSVAYVTSSFSFEAGASGSAAFREKIVAPVLRSKATPPVGAGERASARASRCASGGAASAEPSVSAKTASAANAARRRRLLIEPLLERTRISSSAVGLRAGEDGPRGPCSGQRLLA